MSNSEIGDVVEEWELIRREGRLELWKHISTGVWGIYLYENVKQDDEWLLWKECDSEDKAMHKFERIMYMFARLILGDISES
jgi:hypothetical protein